MYINCDIGNQCNDDGPSPLETNDNGSTVESEPHANFCDIGKHF